MNQVSILFLLFTINDLIFLCFLKYQYTKTDTIYVFILLRKLLYSIEIRNGIIFNSRGFVQGKWCPFG